MLARAAVAERPEATASEARPPRLDPGSLRTLASAVGNRGMTRMLQRDLARPPARPGAVAGPLTAEEIEAAVAFNEGRFSDPYTLRVIRDVIGVAPVPAVVDQEMIEQVAQWQAEHALTPDGKVGHLTTRSIYLELVAERQLRDAVLLLIDSYALPSDLRLQSLAIGTGARCCGDDGGADAVTSGGPHCGGGGVRICFCRARIPRTVAEYNHFVRIAGHELVHVPQCAAGTGNVDVDEFEAFFFEACSEGRAPRLAPAQRVDHADIALDHFNSIPPALRTPARTRMRDQLQALRAAGGAGRC